MKYFTLCVSFLLCSGAFGQTDDQIATITSNTNIASLNSLSRVNQNKEELKAVRINLFLKENPSAVRTYKSVDGGLYDLLDIVDGAPVYRSTDNSKAALATRTSRLHNGGSLGLNLEGQNMTIGIWDGGKVMVNHVEFMNNATPSVTRAVSIDAPLAGAPTDSHATHVAGTMIAKGVNPDAKGMAPQAMLRSYNWTNDENEVISEITTNGLLLSNHSYGVPVLNDQGTLNVPSWYMGCYNSSARSWDLISVNAPYYLMVTSAGNSGSDTYTGGLKIGYDKLTGEKNSKNNLVIANANPFASPVNGNIISNPINNSSSQGPSDDGRIKPDIAGDGTALFSTFNAGVTSYNTLTGTSMSSPNVAGTLLLLQQYYSQLKPDTFMRSSTLKGLVCHTALESGPSPGPDAKFGWGLLDAEKAAVLMQNSFSETPTAILSEITISQGETYSFDVNVTDVQNLSATICWIDPAGASRDNQLNSPNAALINDLDIKITKGAETNLPWKLQLSNVAAAAVTGNNTVYNVERVDVNNASGTYTVQISHKGTLSGGSQAVSLVVSGFNSALLSSQKNDLSKLSIFPNPTKNVLNFTSDVNEISDISIIDVSGKIITPRFNLNSKSIDVSNLQSGVYFVRFASNGQFLTKKFVKL